MNASAPTHSPTLGPIRISLMAMAAAAPLMIMSACAASIAFANGAGAPLNFLVIGAALLIFSIGYMAMMNRIKTSGGFYDFIGRGLGPIAATGAALAALLMYLALGAAIGGFLGQAVEGALDLLGLHGGSWKLFGVIGVLVIAALTYLRVALSSLVLGILVVLELIVVAVVSIAVVGHGGSTGDGIGTTSFSWDAFTSGSVAVGLTLNIGAFIGFEGTTLFRRDAKDPDRTIPRATYLTIILISVLYCVGSWLLVEGWGSDVVGQAQENGTALYAVTAARYVGTWASTTTACLICTSAIASIVMCQTLAARYVQRLAVQRILPKGLATDKAGDIQHPTRAITVVTVILLISNGVWLFSGVDPLKVLSLMTAVGASALLAMLILTSLSTIVYFRRNPGPESWLRTLLAPVVSTIVLVALAITLMLNMDVLTGLTNAFQNWLIALAPYLVVVLGGIAGLYVERRHTVSADELAAFDGAVMSELV